MIARTVRAHVAVMAATVMMLGGMRNAAAMRCRAPAVNGLPAAVAADDGALAIDGGTAGVATMGIAAAGSAVMVISCFGGDRGEDGKTGAGSEKSEEFFHDGLR